jgi:hypothetical protein
MPVTVMLTCSSSFTVNTVPHPDSEGLSPGTKAL